MANIDKLTHEGAYLVLNQATKLEGLGKNIIHLEIGQPDFPTPKNIVDAGISALIDGKTKYSPPLGVYSLREEIANKHNISPGQVAVTPSGKAAIFMAMSTVLSPHDEVLYPNPGFPTYKALIEYLGCRAVPYKQLSQVPGLHTKKTKLIIINSPSNPTGEIGTYSELLAITNLNSMVMTDEIYSDIVYGDYQSYYDIADKDKTILVSGFSKSYSMTGWRIGYMAFPPGLEDKIDCLLTHTIGCTATFTQHAAIEALSGPQDSVKEMVKEFKVRRDYIVEELNKIDNVTCATPQGAFYVFPKINHDKSSAWIADYLLKNGVAVLPGSAFGSGGEGYLRLSYATSITNLTEGIRRLKIALNK